MSKGSKEGATRALATAVQRLLVPLVRILLRYGVTHAAFVDISKRVYVRVAARDFQIAGRKQSAARISVLTGLPRKDVARLLVVADEELAIVGERHSRIARVLSGWRNDARFCDGRGRPAALPFEDESAPSFSELVRRYGGDVTARATLDELLRVGALQRLRDGRLKLSVTPFVAADREIDKLGILGDDVADLVSTIDHNLFHGAREPFFQRKLAYDDIPQEAVSKLRADVAADAEQFLIKHDAAVSRQDRDVTPTVRGTGRKRVVVGVWYYDHDYDEDDDTEPGDAEE
ncbi:MAG TPA: DUF6502 family protein [Candidatus Binatia bacterium]|nr:DUF6502 family protein [Candidatus Binatia bacterium]